MREAEKKIDAQPENQQTFFSNKRENALAALKRRHEKARNPLSAINNSLNSLIMGGEEERPIGPGFKGSNT